jgi:hypothetical protein
MNREYVWMIRDCIRLIRQWLRFASESFYGRETVRPPALPARDKSRSTGGTPVQVEKRLIYRN